MSEREELIDALSGILDCVHPQGVADQAAAALRADDAEIEWRRAMSDEQPCGRDGCGRRILCCRPDCPLVTATDGEGLTTIYTRAEFREECRRMLAEMRARGHE